MDCIRWPDLLPLWTAPHTCPDDFIATSRVDGRSSLGPNPDRDYSLLDDSNVWLGDGLTDRDRQRFADQWAVEVALEALLRIEDPIEFMFECSRRSARVSENRFKRPRLPGKRYRAARSTRRLRGKSRRVHTARRRVKQGVE